VLLAHRVFVLMRALRSGCGRATPARLRRHAARLKVAVGYRLTAPRVSMEISGVDLVQPILPRSWRRPHPRRDMERPGARGARTGAGYEVHHRRALESRAQRDCAVRAGLSLDRVAPCGCHTSSRTTVEKLTPALGCGDRFVRDPTMFAPQNANTPWHPEPRRELVRTTSKSTHCRSAEPFWLAVRALVWPTRTLVGSERWFDELYVWTADFEPDRSLRAQIQLAALEHAFSMLENERVERVAVTISFGSVERSLEALVRTSTATASHASIVCPAARRDGTAALAVPCARVHRSAAQLPGPVGYRFAEPRASME